MNRLLNKLLDKATLIKSKNNYYLSIYFPVTNQNRKNIDTYIKSNVLQALREHKELKDKTRLHNNIIEKILEKIDQTIKFDLKRGIAIFIEFNAYKQQKGRLDEIQDSNINIVSFTRKPKKEISIGNIYSLGQLIWMTNVYTEALVLSLNDDECSIFEIDGKEIDKIHTIINTRESDEKEFFRVYSPTGDIATTHGTGSNIKERNNENSRRAVLKEALDYISSQYREGSGLRYFALLYSNLYSNFIEDTINQHNPFSKDVTPIYISKNIKDPNEIIKIVQAKIRELQKTEKKDRLGIAKENYNYYREGWVECLKAINMRQVSQLFIKPVNKKTGYLDLKNKFLSTYPKKGTAKVGNITPWVVKSVIDNGGEIYLLRDENNSGYPEIASQLRYEKTR